MGKRLVFWGGLPQLYGGDAAGMALFEQGVGGLRGGGEHEAAVRGGEVLSVRVNTQQGGQWARKERLALPVLC